MVFRPVVAAEEIWSYTWVVGAVEVVAVWEPFVASESAVAAFESAVDAEV